MDSVNSNCSVTTLINPVAVYYNLQLHGFVVRHSLVYEGGSSDWHLIIKLTTGNSSLNRQIFEQLYVLKKNVQKRFQKHIAETKFKKTCLY